MRTKLIILSTLIFFLLSSFWLAFLEKRQSDENYHKEWWALSFVDPKNNQLSFILENHSEKAIFEWKILNGQKELQKNEVVLQRGEKKEIFLTPTELNISGKTIINVLNKNKNDKKQIYKNL